MIVTARAGELDRVVGLDYGADDYLAGWERSPWTEADGTPDEVLDRVVAELDAEWPADRIAGYLDGLGT